MAHARLDGIDANVQKLMTLDPRRYGFHATVVAPFHSKSISEDDFIAAASAYASKTAPIRIGGLRVATIGDFVAVVPTQPNEEILQFAADCLETFDACRAPLSAADRDRRLKSKLTPHQTELMERWGYPYVLDEYRFHMAATFTLGEEKKWLKLTGTIGIEPE